MRDAQFVAGVCGKRIVRGQLFGDPCSECLVESALDVDTGKLAQLAVGKIGKFEKTLGSDANALMADFAKS